MRRASGVLQAKTHVYRTLHLGGEVLDIKVAQHGKELLAGNALCIGRLKDLVHRPPDNAGIVLVIPQERHRRRNGLDAAVYRGRQERECSALALAPGGHAGDIGLVQRGGKIHRPFYIAERTSIIKGLFCADTPVYPAVLPGLEDALVPHAHQELNLFRISIRIHIIRLCAVAHVHDLHGILAGRIGNGDDTAGNGPAPGSIANLIAGTELVGIFRKLLILRLQRHLRQFLEGGFPESV